MSRKLADKLKMKPGSLWLISGAPAAYLDMLGSLDGITVSYTPTASADGVQLFATNSHEMQTGMALINSALRPDTILWVMYPKKNKGIVTDLEMMGS